MVHRSDGDQLGAQMAARRGGRRLMGLGALAACVALTATLFAAAPVASAAPVPTNATAATQGDGPLGCTIPDSANGKYVQRLYVFVFVRCADTGGLDFWTAALDGGTSRATVVSSLIFSHEYLAQQVILLYRGINGSSGLEPSDQQIAAALASIRQSRAPIAFAASLWSSDALYAEECGEQPAPDECFIKAAYMSFLRRQPSSADVTFWRSVLDVGPGGTSTAASRDAFLLAVLHSSEARRAYVVGIYGQYLQRPADSSGETFWVDYLADHSRFDFVISIFSSNEVYRDAQSPLVVSSARAAAKTLNLLGPGTAR